MSTTCPRCQRVFSGTLGTHGIKCGVTPADRFWQKVNKTDTCWLWTGAVNWNGYGLFGYQHGRVVIAHRFAWTLTNGEPQNGLHVLHKCDVRRCCNPAHLFLGTNEENMADKIAKGRHSRGATSPTAKLTEAQALEIRRDYKRTGYNKSNVKELAAKYGIGPNTVYMIATGRTWKHLPSLPGDSQ